MILFFLRVFPFYLLGLLVGLLALAFLWRRSGVPAVLHLTLLLPLLVWAGLSPIVGPGGSLANAFLEPLLLGGAVSVIQWVRLIFPGASPSQARVRYWIATAAEVLVALGIVLWFPDLPE